MTRVSMVDPSDADGPVAVLFEAVTAMLGRVPNSYRVLARTPVVAQYLAPFNAVLQREGAGSLLPAKIKEMAVIKTSHTNGCAY
jgi:alkylhydroperoxidase family enzyme